MSLTEEFESEERLDLLEKLQGLLEANNLSHARVESWAAFWVADIESLRSIASLDPISASAFVAGNPMILDAVEICKCSKVIINDYWANSFRGKPKRG